MPKNIRAYITRQFIGNALRAQAKQLGMLLFILVVITVISFIEDLRRNDPTLIYSVLWIDALLIICMLCLNVAKLVQGYAGVRASFHLPSQIRYVVDPDGLTVDDGRVTRRYQWGALRRLVRFPDAVLLDLGEDGYLSVDPEKIPHDTLLAAQASVAIAGIRKGLILHERL